jgi:hypothetical protein
MFLQEKTTAAQTFFVKSLLLSSNLSDISTEIRKSMHRTDYGIRDLFLIL